MTDIRDRVDEVLGDLFDHYFDCMPEFSENDEPDTYAVYSIREKPANFASGKYHAKSYWVSLSIFTTEIYDFDLYSRVETAFAEADFIYTGGQEVKGYEDTEPFPHRCQYVQEYIIDMEV